jgi:polysaccharide biosynthesis protein PslG
MSRTARTLTALTTMLLALAASAPAPAPASASASAESAQTPAVQAHLLWSRYDRSDVETQLDRVKAAGAGMVRVDLGWASLEKEGKGRYDPWYLGKIDHVVAEAGERGIKVLFTVWETPCWASTAPETEKQGCAGSWWSRGVQRYGPINPADFGDAVAYLVHRYGNRVAAWELWNEPNHSDFLKASNQVTTYANLVKAAYPKAKAADPAAKIIAGSLADADYAFTESLYEHGLKGNFDAYSVHPYSEDRSPLHRGFSGWEKKSFVSGVPRVRDTLLRHGDDKQLWLTEFGWSTCTVRGDDAWDNCVDETTQAAWLKEAFARMQSWSYVDVGVWFNLEDTSADEGDRVDNYGLLRQDGSDKPAYGAFRDAAGAVISNRAVAASTPQRRIRLRVYRRGGRVYIRGRARGVRKVTVRAHRYSRSRRRYSRRGIHRRVIRVSSSGLFKTRLRSRGLKRGRWKLVAKSWQKGFRPASARLR